MSAHDVGNDRSLSSLPLRLSCHAKKGRKVSTCFVGMWPNRRSACMIAPSRGALSNSVGNNPVVSALVHTPQPRIGRPPKRPPADAMERIRQLSAEGHSTVAIAQQLGVGRKTLDKWRTEFPELDEAYREGVDRERFTLHSKLVEKAKAGNIVAAMFLLKARHGYREGDQADHSGRVNVTIALPGAMTLQQFTALSAPPPSTLEAKEPTND